MRYDLQVEGWQTVVDVSDKQIVAAIDALNPDGGPGFAILEAGADDYVQTAGGDEEYVVEWREYSSKGFRHLVAGVGPTAESEHRVPTNGYFVTVRTNEVLSAADVKSIFLAFRHGKGKPANFTWRDDSARFQQPKPWWKFW